MTERVGGLVLCGGESRRMGRAKAWLPVGDECMLQRVVRILSGVVQPVVVVAAPGQEVPPLGESVAVVRDDRPGRGPLEGIAAGLRALAGANADAAYVSSCDVPLLQPAFVVRVRQALEDWDIAVPFVAGRHHPLAAVYRIGVLAAVDRLLQAERRRPVFLFESARTRMLTADELREADPDLQSLRNVNTPEDYELALQVIAESEQTRGEPAR
jgi:molybdopterin-guanine dinucleotide biosynthesis protein A